MEKQFSIRESFGGREVIGPHKGCNSAMLLLKFKMQILRKKIRLTPH